MSLRREIISNLRSNVDYKSFSLDERGQFVELLNDMIDEIEAEENEIIDVALEDEDCDGLVNFALETFSSQKPLLLNAMDGDQSTVMLTVVADERDATHRASDGTLYRLEMASEDQGVELTPVRSSREYDVEQSNETGDTEYTENTLSESDRRLLDNAKHFGNTALGGGLGNSSFEFPSLGSKIKSAVPQIVPPPADTNSTKSS